MTSTRSLPKVTVEVHPPNEPKRNIDSVHGEAAEPERMEGADKEEVENVSSYRLDVIEDHHHHHDEEEQEEEEEDEFDVVVVNQTPLNEVTSMTDRTSPWTSILSDPDLASLESGDQTEDVADLTLEDSGGSQRKECVGDEDDNSLVGSGVDASDLDSDSDDVALQDVPQEVSEEEQGPSILDSPQQAYPFSLLTITSAVCK